MVSFILVCFFYIRRKPELLIILGSFAFKIFFFDNLPRKFLVVVKMLEKLTSNTLLGVRILIKLLPSTNFRPAINYFESPLFNLIPKWICILHPRWLQTFDSKNFRINLNLKFV